MALNQATCAHCGEPLPEYSGRGRPQRFCTTDQDGNRTDRCEQAARLRRRLGLPEDALAPGRGWRGRTTLTTSYQRALERLPDDVLAAAAKSIQRDTATVRKVLAQAPAHEVVALINRLDLDVPRNQIDRLVEHFAGDARASL